MARNAETLVVLLDVGQTMRPHLDRAKRFLFDRINQLLLFNQKDDLAIVIFGSDVTRNDLHEPGSGGYENVAVVRPIRVADTEAFQTIESVRAGKGNPDFINAIVVAIDLLVKSKGTTKESKAKGAKRANKRLLLITDGASPLELPMPGTTQLGQVRELAGGAMSVQGITMDIVLLRSEAIMHARGRLVEENEMYLQTFATMTRGELRIVNSFEPLLYKIRHRVSPTTLYRGEMEILKAPNGDLTKSMTIKIWIYKKSQAARFPLLKPYSDKAASWDPHASHKVEMSREYKLVDNPDKVVAPEEIVKAYRYGPQVIPISEELTQALQYDTEKGFKLVGFVAKGQIPRHFYMKESMLVLPEPDDEKAAVALSALARAMSQSSQAALVRYKFTAKKGAGPTLGILTPRLAEKADQVDAFVLNILPFAEDIREYVFPSFNDAPANQQPSTSQREAADRLVSAMSLVVERRDLPGMEVEQVKPEETANPVLQRFYRFVETRFKDPNAAVPPLEGELLTVVEPEVTTAAAEAVSIFANSFPLVLATQAQTGASRRRIWNEPIAEAGAIPSLDGLPANDIVPAGMIRLEDLASKGPPSEVGSSTPVEDFNAMLDRRDGDAWVPKAISGMKRVIEELIDQAYERNTYPRALSGVAALRKGCILQQEPSDFNEFLRHLKSKCQGRRRDDFWQEVVIANISLITQEEAPDSLVTTDEAARFIGSADEKTSEVTQGAEEEETEDLLDQIE
eukprot:TRINITY_DN6925_c0_g1_i1.p1 TRINITY_DN6925_c0_g1~~TRINITY_DN6925_c0_g1_i1.p1  ORF type:complete len:740 (+),score=127.18 TRINITY_DN6925_c0_g1_i1:23-2242(+)